MISIPSTSTESADPDRLLDVPIPKPRRLLAPLSVNWNCRNFPKKAPVPSPRKSLLNTSAVARSEKCTEDEEVRLRKALIRRESYRPICINREKLQWILKNSGRPASYPSHSFHLDISFYDNVEDLSPMSARAIAVARSRGHPSSSSTSNERPLSAYEESPEATRQRNRRRASVAVMPMLDVEIRDQMVTGNTLGRRRGRSDGADGTRDFSPDFGAIRVQVEDITAIPMNDEEERVEVGGEGGHHDPFDTTAETSTETVVDKNSTMPGGVAEWAVPSEYACSPIAQELTQSEVEERPRPPIPTMYMNTSVASTEREEDSVYSDFVLRRNSSTSSMSGKSVTLLEQIIRTHAVWYLPHLGRPEVLHLLRQMEPGNFIVRASTRENCMALSVKLAPGAHVEIDHYIIEKLTVPAKNSGAAIGASNVKVVRLEGSPLTFRSLPLLIEHYCVNEDELEHRLQLPSAIRACTTTKQLQSIAMMEQEFWAREMSLSRQAASSRNSVSSYRSTNNNTMPRCHGADSESTWFMKNHQNNNDDSIYDEVALVPREKYYAVNETPKNGNPNHNSGVTRRSSAMLLTPEMAMGVVDKTPKKRRSSSRSSSNSRFATVCVGDFLNNSYDSNKNMGGTEETDSGTSTHSPPSKHDRVDGEGIHISRTDRRSQSVRSHKSVTASPKGGRFPSSTSSTLSRPRSFLRSLLSFGSSSKEHKRKESLDIDSTPRLASCEYFTPWDTSGETPKVRSSRSAFDITNPPPARGFFGSATTKKRNIPAVSSKKKDMFDDDNYTRGWKQAPFVEMAPTSNHQQNNGHLTDTSGMRTFKPPNYDEVANLSPSSSSSSSSRCRPLAMRRERSDLGTGPSGINFGIVKNNAQRLAFHNESSPGPANMGRIPMTPPANAGDPQVQQNCVEELRRKRLQSANEMLAPQESTSTKQFQQFGEVHSAHASPQIAMRRRNNGFPSPSPSTGLSRNYAGVDRLRNGEHRLSVPNLIAATDPMIPGSVGQSAKALRERLGGRNTDGELMVINEGLVTPVVRRKTFAPAELAAGRELADKRRHPSDTLSSTSSSEHSSLGRRKTSTSPSTTAQLGASPTESELVWRRAKHTAPPSTGIRTSAGSNQSQNNNWSAINSELKNRQQKIAKVLPTPQPRGHHNRNMSIVGTPSDCRRSSSDYAQICDFATSSNGGDKMMHHLDAHHSKIDDDAVSVAGTVFNEPWDSNVWENLLDLAHHGDETALNGLKVSEPIQEEDTDSDRTADSTCHMSDSDEDNDEEEELENFKNSLRRPLPSDRVTVKGWDQESGHVTLNGSISGTLRRHPDGSFSIRSLPRALSRFMGSTGSFGSLDDLPTTLIPPSPLLGGRTSRAMPRGNMENEKIGRAVQEYVEQLARVQEGHNACFGLTLKQFVACTKETKETDPAVVIRNVRQFINGMKNYLVKHGEGDLHRIIDEESARLNSNQILNIDAVLEAVLHKLLLREVKPLLYHVMIREHSKAGALQLISVNIGLVRKMNLQEMGFSSPELLVTPSATTMEQVKLMMRKMQSHYSPMKKLENLMKAVGLVLGCQKSTNGNENDDPTTNAKGLPPADDLVRWFVYILARTSTVGCEVEAWYMWELLPQPIVTQSDASYYLTSLWSAVHVLKSAESIRRLCENEHRVHLQNSRNLCSSPLLSTATLTRGTSAAIQMVSAATCDAFVKIAVPDEAVGCVRYATFPGVPMLTTSKLSRLVAHQQGITNPEEHGLYLIAEGFESCLGSTECPILIHEQLKKENKPHMFAYKRHEAKIAWPRAAITAF